MGAGAEGCTRREGCTRDGSLRPTRDRPWGDVWGCGAGECARHQWKERWKYETIRCSDLMKYVSTDESASVGFSYRKLCATWEGG